MSHKLRELISISGADIGEGSWLDVGDYTSFASFTSTSTATLFYVSIVPQPTSSIDRPNLFLPIGRLQGGQVAIMGATAMAAQTTLNFGWLVYHTFGTLGTQITNAGGALTSLNVAAPGINASMPSGQTFQLTNAAGTVQTWTTSAAVASGALSIPVNSQTPTGTNAVGNAFNGVLGNGIACGWVSGLAGTPAMPVNGSITMPMIATATNTLVVPVGADPFGPYLPLWAGDVIALEGFSAGSVTVQAGIASFEAV